MSGKNEPDPETLTYDERVFKREISRRPPKSEYGANRLLRTGGQAASFFRRRMTKCRGPFRQALAQGDRTGEPFSGDARRPGFSALVNAPGFSGRPLSTFFALRPPSPRTLPPVSPFGTASRLIHRALHGQDSAWTVLTP